MPTPPPPAAVDASPPPAPTDPSDRDGRPSPRARGSAVAAAIIALAAAWAWRADALVVWRAAAAERAAQALPDWAAGWFYVPGHGFLALAADERYGEPVVGHDGAGRPVVSVAAVYPAWYARVVERPAWLPWMDDFTVDRTRPATEDVGHAYDIRILAPATVTVTVRGGDGRRLGWTVFEANATPLGPYLFDRDDGPVSITAEADAFAAVVTQTLRAVADGTGIAARDVGAQADLGGVRLDVARLAAWPGGVAVRLNGRTTRPRDKVFVTTIPIVSRDVSATPVLTPTVRLRDDTGRVYPLIGAEAIAPSRYYGWLERDPHEDTHAPAPPEAAIGLPATLLFGRIADDATAVHLEIDDTFVVVSEDPVPDSRLAFLVRSWGDVLSLPLPARSDRAAWPTRSSSRVFGLKSGKPVTTTPHALVEIGGSRAEVEAITTDGDVVTVRLRPLPGGFGRLLSVAAREFRGGRGRLGRCDHANSWSDSGWVADGRVRVEWPVVTVKSFLDDPSADSARLCFENPLIVVEGRWTLPLPAGRMLADQRTNGTGARTTP